MIKESTEFNVINALLKPFNVEIDQIGPYSKYALYCLENNNIGIINYDIIYDRAELDYIYVLEEFRNKKFASKLVEYMIEDCKKNNCKSISLEVRESNISAIKLYEKYGFKVVAKRSNYYKEEDALLMVKEV